MGKWDINIWEKDRPKDKDAKVTQSKLVPIRNASEFREMVKTTAHRVYEDAGQRSTRTKKGKQRKLSCFETALCVVLLKVKKADQVCVRINHSSGATSSIVSTTKVGKQPAPFTFYVVSFVLISMHL